jgi:hypothetical protein
MWTVDIEMHATDLLHIAYRLLFVANYIGVNPAEVRTACN